MKTTDSKPSDNLAFFLVPLICLLLVLCVALAVHPIRRQPVTTTKKTTTKPADVQLSDIHHDFYNGEVIGHVTSRKLGIDCDLVYGTDDGDLMKGAGLHTFSSLPGFATDPLIAGHARLSFSGFANAKKGDEITVTMPYGTYVYRISDIQVMDKWDFSFDTLNRQNHQAIFYACYPFYKTNYTKMKRIFFTCDQIRGPSVKDGSRDAVSPDGGNGSLANM
ncbi:MAG: sortase [Oscillospiraceae bacterium]|nr:sortase [Oscillospiraceae bacterium]